MKINQYITCFVLSALLTTACGDDTFERPGYYDRTASDSSLSTARTTASGMSRAIPRRAPFRA